jgi:hypothetical protein
MFPPIHIQNLQCTIACPTIVKAKERRGASNRHTIAAESLSRDFDAIEIFAFSSVGKSSLFTLVCSWTDGLNFVIAYRFPEMFPDVAIVREVQQELDTVIEEGVVNIVNLLKNQVRGRQHVKKPGQGSSTLSTCSTTRSVPQGVVNIVNLLNNQVSSSGCRQHCQPPQKPGQFFRGRHYCQPPQKPGEFFRGSSLLSTSSKTRSVLQGSSLLSTSSKTRSVLQGPSP